MQRDLLLAEEYALGTLEGPRRRRAERLAASDPAFAALVAAARRRLAALAAGLPGTPPPAAVWQAIEAALPPAAAPLVLRSGEGEWMRVAPGVRIKRLRDGPAEGARSLLVRLDPGAAFPEHDHALPEECLVLEGGITMGETRFAAGDYMAVAAQGDHPPIISEGGALLFVRVG